jgi:hypothetical protein
LPNTWAKRPKIRAWILSNALGQMLPGSVIFGSKSRKGLGISSQAFERVEKTVP